jgi:hypothetical protein
MAEHTENENNTTAEADAGKEKKNKSIKKLKRSVTYGEIDNVSKAMKEAPELKQEEKTFNGGKENIIKLLKNDIVEYLKKGYSTLAAVEFINSKLPSLGITEKDVKALLPLVTKKRRSKARNEQAKENSSKSNMRTQKKDTDSAEKIVDKKIDVASDSSTQTEQAVSQVQSEEKIKTGEDEVLKAPNPIKRGMPKYIPEEERIYLAIQFEEKDEAKALGAKFDSGTKKWYIWSKLPPDEKDKFKRWLE